MSHLGLAIAGGLSCMIIGCHVALCVAVVVNGTNRLGIGVMAVSICADGWLGCGRLDPCRPNNVIDSPNH